jgi:DNA-directed RNA polymerase subunit RPC12/RpoP
MSETAKPGARQDRSSQPGECGHQRLVKVEAAGVNDIDTEVLVYVCSACGKSFAVSDA